MSSGLPVLWIFRSILLFLLASGVPVLSQAQLHLKQADITVTLPNKYWKLYEEKALEKGTYLYVFKRAAMSDSSGNQITPNIAVVSEPVAESVDVVSYSIMLRSRTGFKVTQSLTSEDLKCIYKNLVAYKGTYTDRKGLSHTIYVIYLIRNNIGTQIILDTTTDLFPKCDKEFRKFMKSIS